MMFRSMAHVVDLMDQSGFNQTSWLPVHSWTYSGGDYVIAVHGDRFAVGGVERLSEEDIPEIPLDLGISLEREELGEDSAE